MGVEIGVETGKAHLHSGRAGKVTRDRSPDVPRKCAAMQAPAPSRPQRSLHAGHVSVYEATFPNTAWGRRMAEAKKLFIKTYGCQMNVYDSERMAEAMGAEGYVMTETVEDADMVLLNTCHIREKASEKLYSD